ncbi:MAG: hypothetical protein ACPGUV_15185 [Polyangiales bacterium]
MPCRPRTRPARPCTRRPLCRPVLWLGSLCGLLGACEQSAGTGGEAASLPLYAAGVAEAGLPLGHSDSTLGAPWRIELSEARVLLGPVYVYAPPTLAARLQRQVGALLHSVAHAHAGDDNLQSARVMAEMLQQQAVDALNPASQALGFIDGEAGPVQSLSLVLDEARGPLAVPTGPTAGHHAWVRGIARKAGRELRFEAGLDMPDTPLSRRIDELPLGGSGQLQSGHHLKLSLYPGRWLQQVDFDRLAAEPAASDGVHRPAPGSQFHTAFYLGLRNTAAFSARSTLDSGE